jgi:hypothetical protein
MMYALVFTASFFSVFLLGFNSKLLRDDHIALASFVSWLITIAQYGMTWAVFSAGLSAPQYLFWAGLGGSCGITISQYFYRWLDNHLPNRRN